MNEKRKITLTFECHHLCVVRIDGMSIFQSHIKKLAEQVLSSKRTDRAAFCCLPVVAHGRRVNNVHRI